ncbi:TetR/AcrR family transcriptional regulator [Rhodococcus triatomae]|nr:TetR family transcriptional regulator [Rhodococcus triatomae BKS 15-14]
MGRRPDTDGRARLTAAALALFADHGVDATSIRAVNRAAGLGPASVHYHFGTKDALVDEALGRYGDRVVETIVRAARTLTSRSDPVRPHELIEMFSTAYDDLLLDRSPEVRSWIRLVDRYLAGDPARVADPRATAEAASAVRRGFPHARENEIGQALTLAIRVYVGALAERVHRLDSHDESSRNDAREELRFMVTFLAGGLAAALDRSVVSID